MNLKEAEEKKKTVLPMLSIQPVETKLMGKPVDSSEPIINALVVNLAKIAPSAKRLD